MSKWLERTRKRLLESDDYGPELEDFFDFLKEKTESVDTAFEENKHSEVVRLLSEITEEVDKYSDELSWDTLEAFSEYEHELTENIQEELEDFEDELKQSSHPKYEKNKSWFFWGIFSKAKTFLNTISTVKTAAWAWAWVLSFMGYENYWKYLKAKGTTFYNNVRWFFSSTLWKFNPFFQYSPWNEWVVWFENERELFKKFPEDEWLKPGVSLSAAESFNRLTSHYRIRSTRNWYDETWESREADCTCLDWLQADTIIGARNLARLIQDKVWILWRPTITWGTEEWHADWSLSHYNWNKLDFSVWDMRWKTVINNFNLVRWVPKTIILYWQEITLLHHWDDPHIDASFWKIPKERNLWNTIFA